MLQTLFWLFQCSKNPRCIMTNTNFFFILQRASNCHWGQKRCTFAQRSWKKYPASTRGICRWRGCRILISFNQKKKNWPNCYIRYSSKKFILNYMVLGYWDSKFRESNKRKFRPFRKQKCLMKIILRYITHIHIF